MALKSARQKLPAASFPVPQNADEAAAAIGVLGVAQRERALIETAMNECIALTKTKFENDAKPYKEQIEQLTRGLHVYAEANREALTSGGKVKFHRFASGEVSWRSRPPKVTIRAVEAVIEACKRLGLTQFIRSKEEINKEAMLHDPETARTIAGVKIGSDGEEFIVKPLETQLEEVAP